MLFAISSFVGVLLSHLLSLSFWVTSNCSGVLVGVITLFLDRQLVAIEGREVTSFSHCLLLLLLGHSCQSLALTFDITGREKLLKEKSVITSSKVIKSRKRVGEEKSEVK